MCISEFYDGEIWNLSSKKTDVEESKMLTRELGCWKNVCVGQYKGDRIDRIWNFIAINRWVHETLYFLHWWNDLTL